MDIICIIDESGSMSGEKIKKVKESLVYLVNQLTAADRLSIVCFEGSATIRCQFTNDKSVLLGVISQLRGNGGTNITSGVEKAIRGKFTSLILLSYGEDSNAEVRCRPLLQTQRSSSQFTLHTIGYGDDHQVDMMKALAKIGNGAYYSVRLPTDMNAAIAMILGGAVSTFAHSIAVKLDLSRTSCPVELRKVYGKSGNQFEVPDLSFGGRKDIIFVFRFSPNPRQPEGHRIRYCIHIAQSFCFTQKQLFKSVPLMKRQPRLQTDLVSR